MFYLDAGTTYSKVISDENFTDRKYFKFTKNNLYYYIMPSNLIKSMNITPTHACGHMSNSDENEIIALAKGSQKLDIDANATILDLGSRDAKWIRFKDNKFHDMDWNTSCASSTGATVEMLLKFYNVKPENLKFDPEKFVVTCGIFGIEKIMDSISNGTEPENAISKFVHGIAYNAWNFAKKPKKYTYPGDFVKTSALQNHFKTTAK